MAKKKRKGNFRNKIRRDVERQETASSSYGYLNLPSGVSVFNPEPGSRVKMDIIPYEVTDTNHPDKFEDEQIAVAGDLWYKRPFKIHRNVGSGNDSVVCPTSFGKKCPLCEYRAKRLKEGAPKEEIEELGIGRLKRAVIDGDVDEGTVMAGQVAGMITKIELASEIIGDIIDSAEDIMKNICRNIV